MCLKRRFDIAIWFAVPSRKIMRIWLNLAGRASKEKRSPFPTILEGHKRSPLNYTRYDLLKRVLLLSTQHTAWRSFAVHKNKLIKTCIKLNRRIFTGIHLSRKVRFRSCYIPSFAKSKYGCTILDPINGFDQRQRSIDGPFYDPNPQPVLIKFNASTRDFRAQKLPQGAAFLN